VTDRHSRRTTWLLGATLLFAYAFFAAGQGWNQNSRFALTLSIVEDGVLHIDRWHEGLLPTGDKSFANGHYYSDKAIGSSLAAAVPYALLRPLLQRFDERRRIGYALYAVTVASVAVPAIVCLLLVWRFALGVRGDPREALFAPLAVGLGTPLWTYSTVLFGHVLVGACLFGTFWLLHRVRREPERATSATALGVGFLAGFGLVTEYTVAPLFAILGGYALFVLAKLPRGQQLRCVGAALAGVAVPLGTLMAYNAASFGSPFALSYRALANEQFQQIHAHGVVGIGWPSLEVLWYLTLHPVRGLFAHAPVLLLMFPGFYAMSRRPEWRPEAAVVAGCFATLLLLNAGFPMWWGGWSANARHLVPVLFLLAVPLAFVERPWRPLVVVLLVVSVIQTFLVVATTPMTSDSSLAAFLSGRDPSKWIPLVGYSPIYLQALPQIWDGQIAWSPARSLTRGSSATMSLFFVVLSLALRMLWRLTRSRAARQHVPESPSR
jgi:hypothetical protein